VDALVLDVTNAVHYWEDWDVIFNVMLEMKKEGNKVPKFVMWTFNGPVITVVQNLYERIYKTGKYKELWFYWDGKPLLLYNGKPLDSPTAAKNINPNYDPAAKTDTSHPHYGDPDYCDEFYQDYTKEVREFFTLRTMWWGYYKWQGERFVGTEDNWSFGYNLADPEVKAFSPGELLSTHNGKREQAAVTAAQHPVSFTDVNMGVGKSWSREHGEPELNEYDMPEPAYVPWLGETVERPEGYGIYFQERWDEAIEANPEFIYINDWNEWFAGKWHPQPGEGVVVSGKWFPTIGPDPTGLTMPFLGRDNPFIFADQYNAEFNRCIGPMKGGYTDNYYMQMAQNIRRYKGVRPIPVNLGTTRVKIDGKFGEWEQVLVEYRDTRGDVVHRDHPGYGDLHYKDESGRNDILTSKVALTRKQVCFYVETDKVLTSHEDPNWMLLLIDADQDVSTGWYGYDYLVNGRVTDSVNTSIMEYDGEDWQWEALAPLDYGYAGNQLELAIPRDLIGITGSTASFDFKWSDNPAALEDPISLCLHGDTAPNRRFNYRFKWKK
jgi:hypothetical protein